jgi:hypothetical protein
VVPETAVRRARDLAHRVLGVDLRALAVLRIGLGLAVLADLAVRASDLHAFYTDAGVLSRSDALGLFGWLHAWPLCVHMVGGSFWSQVLLFLLAATAAAALVVGWRTRLATAVTWLLTMSVQLRNPFVGAGYDQLLRMLLFWGCFLPLGARMSVDSIRQPARTDAWLSVGTVALLVQVIIVYASAGISKWLQPAWHDGSALLSILDDDFRVTASGLLLARAPDLARSFARVVPLLELGGAALLLVPSAVVRTATVVMLCAMNVLFGLCLDIGLFPWVASVALFGLLPSWVWERPVVDAWVVQPIDRAAAWLARRLPAHVPRPWRRVGALEAVCAVFLAYVVVWCVGVARDSGYRARPEIEWLGSTFFLQQDWRMFSVPPTRSGWVVIPGRLTDGREVDLLRAGGPVPRADGGSVVPATWDKPAVPSRLYRNDRWRLFLSRAVYGPGTEEWLRHYGRYLCREWNAAPVGVPQLESFQIVFMVAPVPGPAGARVYQREIAWTHRCLE